ncbi:hypothetical protein NDU88_003160 [Pleurodeles waltl]|uniref:Uncharacterized protein n=1 Tax=Pleurodeles waltl TaxID=8319 RepID=A0AAV7NFW7_PLEWA|nr:hypothetical protein NDU88_003160 [Pleurodeles waltl]
MGTLRASMTRFPVSRETLQDFQGSGEKGLEQKERESATRAGRDEGVSSRSGTRRTRERRTYYSSNKSKGSPLAHGRSDQIRLSDLIGCPIQRYGAADVSCGDGAVIRRLSGDQRIDPR